MQLVFLHSSDTHGFLLPTDYQNKTDYNASFSLSRVSSVIKAEKKKYGANNVVVTDAGDCLQGSPLLLMLTLRVITVICALLQKHITL